MLRGDVLQLTGLDIKQEGRMNEFLKNGSYSEYAQRNGLAVKDFGRHNGMAGRKKGSFGSSQRNAIADSVEEQQENSFDPRKYSKASSYRKSRHTHDKLSCALGDYGAVSGGIEKNAADLIPDIYDEIFRLPPKMSSSSKFSELPVLDPSAYYDEEDLFSTTTVIRNSAAGVIYEDIFGGGLASGPTYTDLSDLLEYFGVSNSRSQTSSSSGLYVESPIPVSDSFRGEPDDNGHFRSNDSSKLEFSGKYPTPLQSRSVNSFSQTDVGEEPYIGLPREHAGHRNKRGSRRFSKNGEGQKERTNDVVQQASKAPTYTEKSFPLSTDADPVSTVQSSCSNNFSALISHGKSYSSHDYTRDWLKSIGGFKDRSESIKAIDSDKKASLLFNQGVLFEDRFLSLEIHESMKTAEVQKVIEDKRQKDRLHDDVWLTIDNLKLKTIPSVTPPPSRLPPMPRDIPKAVPVKMPDWHAPGNGHARWKAHENGIEKKKQELCASAEPDFALNFPVSLARNEADVYRVSSFKEGKTSGTDAVACDGETDKILTSVIPNDLNTKFQAEERLIGTSESHGRGEQAHLSDVEDKVLKKQQEESLMSATVADYFRGAKQQERKTIAVESADQMEEETTISATGTNHLHGIKQAERTTLSVENFEHKEEEISIFQVNGVQGTEGEIITDATSNNQVWNSKDDKEGEMVMDATVADHLHGIEQKKRMTLLSEKSEHKEEEVIILAVDGAGCTEEVRKKEESRSSKVNKEITASNMQIENRGVKFKPEADTIKKQTTDREGDHSMRLKEENKRNRPSILEAKERVTQPESAMMEKQTVHRERINEGENKRNNISILEVRGRVTQKGLEIEKKTGNRKGDHSMRMNEDENKRERFSILEEREIVIPPDLVVLEKQTRDTEANSIFRETVKVTQLDSEIIEKQSGQREGDLSMSPNEEQKMMNQSSTLEVRERVTQSKLEMEKQTGHRASDLGMRVNEEENKRKKFSVLEERQKVTQSESETMEKQTRNRGGGNLSMRSNKENTTNKLGILEERVKLTTQSESEMEEQNGHQKDDSMFEARARLTQPESEIAEKQSRQRDGDVEEENKRIQSSVLEERERMIPTKSKSEIMEKQSRYREGNLSIRQNERIKRNESSKFKARERLTQPESELMEKQTDHREGDLSMRLNEKGDERNKSSILEVRERVRQPKSEMIEKQIGHGEGCLGMRPDENERNKFSILDVRQVVTQQESEMMVKSTRHGESDLCMRLKEEENKRNKSSVLEEKERIIQSESETMETQSRHREGDLSLSLNEENKRNKPSILDTKESATQSESEEMDKHSRHREGGPHMCPSEENKGNKSSSVEARETVTQTESVHRAGDFSVRLNEECKRNEPSIFEEKETVTQPELEVLEKQTRHREGNLNMKSMEEEDKKNKPRLSEARERMTRPNSNAEDFEAKHKAAKEIEAVDVDRKVSDKRFLDSLEKKDWGVREIEIEIRRREREYESERQKEREMEREKDRMGLGNTLFDLRERSCEQKANLEKMPVNPRERMGRTPMEMAAAVSRENVLERADKTGAEKVAVSRDKAGLAAAERFHVDTSDRVSEKGIAEKLAAEGREQTERAMGIKEQNRKNLNGTGQPSNSSSSFMPKASNDILRSIRRMSDNRSSLNDGKTHDLRNVASESHRRTLERVAKALAEKKQRDLEVQREFAEKERIAGSIDLELKRWSTGKEGNLRALLSTLHYVLWRESGWQTVSLTEIITSAAVKKVYRKATLCVHPDKVQQKGATIRQKYIAEKVFDLLKEAWNKFNIEEQK